MGLLSLLALHPQPGPHNCRFWGLIGSGYPDSLITLHLRDAPRNNLKALGHYNEDGWAFAAYFHDTTLLALSGPLTRRGEPGADHPTDPDYDLAVEELRALRPIAALGNVRLIAERHLGVPDPSPFCRDDWAFMHSGHIREVEWLEELLAEDDPEYIADHPPDYETPRIDSELYFLYVLKRIAEAPASVSAAVREALIPLVTLTDDDRLDFIMTRGDTLYALRYAGADETEPLVYSPAGGSHAHWFVATQPLGDDAASWTEIPPRTLAVLAPGAEVVFHAMDLVPVAQSASMPLPLKLRGWALIGSDYDDALLVDHLQSGEEENLKHLGDPDSTFGWGFASFVADSAASLLNRPLIRRGGPPADHPGTGYDAVVDELAALRPRAALGHVRAASSAHASVPDPHPFQHEGIAFAHNGTVITGPLLDFLEGEDPAYLDRHPPDYHGREGVHSGHIDSELYFLYLLKVLREHPKQSPGDALRFAVRRLSAQTGTNRLNFVMTSGDTLYALRFNDGGGVRFLPSLADTVPSPYWAVASQYLGSDPASAWGTLPRKTMGIFIPHELPALYPIEGAEDPEYALGWFEQSAGADRDQDGWASAWHLAFDPNVTFGIRYVRPVVFARTEGGPWEPVVETIPHTRLNGGYRDKLRVSIPVPEALPPTEWDLKLELFERSEPAMPVLVVDPETHPEYGLDGIRVEGALCDTIPVVPPSRRIEIAWLARGEEVDQDEDGYARSMTFFWDADLGTPDDSTTVYAELFAAHLDSTRFLTRSDTFRIAGAQADTGWMELLVEPPDLSPSTWDLALDLYDAGISPGTLAVRAESDRFSALANVRVEGAANDESEPLPDSTEAWIGWPPPIAGAGGITVPIVVPTGGAHVSMAVWDVLGRLRHRIDPIAREKGPFELRWDATTAASGAYYIRIRVGGMRRLRRCTIVR